VAEELGISKQVVNSWIKGRYKISKKHLPKLVEMFKQPEEYFQKELSELEKLDIQKIKVHNETAEYKDTFDEQYIDYEKDIIRITNEIRDVINKKFEEEAMIAHQSPNEVLEVTKEVLKLYEKLTKIIRHGGINSNIVDKMLDGMINYQLGKPNSRYEFINEITKLVKQEQTRQTEELKSEINNS
jgi:transcriptional regulator with XRE-family HTH domain